MGIRIFIFPTNVFKKKTLLSEHIFHCHLIKWKGEKPRIIHIYRKARLFFYFTHREANIRSSINLTVTKFNLGN